MSLRDRHITLFLILLALLATACAGGENRKDSPRASSPSSGVGADTLYTEKAVREAYGDDPRRALAMIDSGVLVGNIGPDLATVLRATVYCYSSDEWPLDTVSQMLEGLLESDFTTHNPGRRQDVLDLLVGIARRRGDNFAYMRWANEKVDFCRQQNEETEALRTEAEIGAVLTRMGDVEKGLSILDGAIGALDNRRHFNELDACIIALKRKINILSELGRPAGIVPLARRIIAKADDYRHNLDLYNDGTFRIPPTKDKQLEYCDFYTNQAYGYLAIAFSDLSDQRSVASGQPADASRTATAQLATDHRPLTTKYLDSTRHYLSLFKRSDYSKTLDGKIKLAYVYLRLGHYAKVQPLYDEVVARMQGDTVNSDYAHILRGRALMAEAMGNYRAANSYLRRHGNLKDTLNRQLLESSAYKSAAHYHLQEEQLKAERLRVKGVRFRNLALTASALALVLAAFCIRLFRQRRALDSENKALADRLAEAVKGDDTEDVVSEDLSPQKMSDEQLFAYLSSVIRNEKLYTDPNFGRQTLSDRFRLSDRRIGAAFAQGSGRGSMTLPIFVRELRIEHACQLLSGRPDMSIRQIAAASGFGSPIVFNRAFKAKYNLTPTDYREQLQGDN